VAQALACVSGISEAGDSLSELREFYEPERKLQTSDSHHFLAVDPWNFDELVKRRRHRLKPVPLKTKPEIFDVRGRDGASAAS
jgi:hypothetical protein